MNERAPLSVEPNTAESLSFLRRWPAATLQLTAIHVDPTTHEKGLIESRAFDKDAELDDGGPVERWIEERQGKANLYYSVNTLLGPKNSKAEKKDIKEIVAFHVDLDVLPGVDQDAGTQELLGKLREFPLEPSVIVTSGGGVQAFWILAPSDRIPVNGEKARADGAECYTRKLEEVFGSDHTHNVDRIMRLPGTVNLADRKKREKGRHDAVARLVSFTDTRYPLSAFTAATPKDEAPRAARPTAKADYSPIDINDRRLANLDDKWRRLGVEGDVDGVYDGDRSRAQHAFAIECFRAGVDEDAVGSILKHWKIGEHARAQKGGERRAIARQIERAKWFAEDSDLGRMNERFFVAPVGNKTRVVELGPSDEFPGQETITSVTTFEDFANLHSNKRHVTQTDKGPKEEPLGSWWLRQRHRRQYTGGVKFLPHRDEAVIGNDPDRLVLNKWRGFAVQARKPDGASGASGCKLFLDHGLKIICSGNEEHFDYLMKREAKIAQERTRTEVGSVYRTEQEGTGKGTWCNGLGHLYGSHYMEIGKPEHIIGKHNEHLETLLKVTADEALFVGNPLHRNTLWGLITEPTFTVEPKFVGAYSAHNHMNIDITTNAKHVVPVGPSARRIFMPTVSPERAGDLDYFNRLNEELRDGGYEALLYHLLYEVDITDFDVRKVPKTAGLREQAALSRHSVDALVEELCHEGRLPWAEIYEWPDVAITTGEEDGRGFDYFIRTKSDADLRRMGPMKVKHALKEWGCNHWRESKLPKRAGIQFLPLAELRAKFATKHGNVDWRAADVTKWEPSGQPAAKATRPPVQRREAEDEIPF